MVFYFAPYRHHEALLARRGKHKLADVYLPILELLVTDAWEAMAERHPG